MNLNRELPAGIQFHGLEGKRRVTASVRAKFEWDNPVKLVF